MWSLFFKLSAFFLLSLFPPLKGIELTLVSFKYVLQQNAVQHWPTHVNFLGSCQGFRIVGFRFETISFTSFSFLPSSLRNWTSKTPDCICAWLPGQQDPSHNEVITPKPASIAVQAGFQKTKPNKQIRPYYDVPLLLDYHRYISDGLLTRG